MRVHSELLVTNVPSAKDAKLATRTLSHLTCRPTAEHDVMKIGQREFLLAMSLGSYTDNRSDDI